MKFIQALTLTTALTCTGTAALSAEDFNTTTFPAVVERNCPTEWAALSLLAPETWQDEEAFVSDAALDELAATYDKYLAAVLAMADYFPAFIGLRDPKNQNDAQLAVTQAKFHLLNCLKPTPAEENLIVTRSVQSLNEPESTVRKKMFGTFDRYDCMRVDAASQKVFRLDPTQTSFSEDFATALKTTMQACK